jgi:hypothetical protein
MREGLKYLEVQREFDKFSHTFIHLTLHECLPFLREPVPFTRDEVTESRKGICWGLKQEQTI